MRLVLLLLLGLPVLLSYSTATPANAARLACDTPAATRYRAQGGDLYKDGRYSAAGEAFAAAARAVRGCATSDAALTAGTSYGLAGGAFGMAGDIERGATQLRLAQALLATIIAHDPRHAAEARQELAPVQATLDVIARNSM